MIRQGLGKMQNQTQTNGDVGITPFSKHGILSGVVGPAAPTCHTHANANTNTRKRGLVDVRSTNSNSIQRHTPSPKHDNSPSFIGTKRDPLKLKNVRNDMDGGIDHNQMPPPEKKRRTSPSKKTKKKNHNHYHTKVRTIEMEYDLREELGSGTCGQVRRAIHRSSGMVVAVKIIAIGGKNRNFGAASASAKDVLIDPTIRAEASILQDLNHPYIVKLLDVFIHPGQAVYLVMELLHGGDLFDRIVEKGRYSEVESRRVMRRMLAAVHYLHQDRDIVHRDLKPENILCSSRMDDVSVKLTDFGLAKSITEDGLKTFCGTPLYFAPEVLRRQNTVAGRGRYGKEADMWSLGVILYILICGAPPFNANTHIDDNASATKVTFSGPIWRSTSESAKDLILKLLTSDPSERISVVDACSHEWIMTPDNDTHVHPLDDPVVLETSGKRRSNAEDAQIINKNVSSPVPQSILDSENVESNFSPIEKVPAQAKCKNVQKRQVHNNDARRLETVSPNQSANFPTPMKQAPTNGAKTKREPIFSVVKQLSIEGMKPRGNEGKQSSELLGKPSEDEGHNLSPHIPNVASAMEENDDKAKAQIDIKSVIPEGNNDSTSSAPEKMTSSKMHNRLKGKQTTLSSFFGKK